MEILPVYFPLISKGLKTNKFKLVFRCTKLKIEKIWYFQSMHAALNEFFLSLIVLSQTFKHSVK